MSKWIVKFKGLYDSKERQTLPFSSLDSAELARLVIEGYNFVSDIEIKEVKDEN